MPAITGVLDLSLILAVPLSGQRPIVRLNLNGQTTVDYDAILASVAPVTTGDTVAEVIDSAIAAVNVDTLRAAIAIRNLAIVEAALLASSPTITEPAESADAFAFIRNKTTTLTNIEATYVEIHRAAVLSDWDLFIAHLMILYVKLRAGQPHLQELPIE